MIEGADTSRLKNRRALEALRNGVPNGDAVAVLGSSQPVVEREFNTLLSRASNGLDMPDSSLGMLVAGDFGSGKSHLLGYLETQALAQNFVCSKVVISKETPLFDMDKVFKSAVENGRVPGITGYMVDEIAQKLDYNSRSYADFFVWANQDDNGLHRILPATLMVHEKGNDTELLNEINRFWSGEKIALKSVRDGLRHIGQNQSYSFTAPAARDLPPQKLRFVLELIKAAGYRGWVVLVDEIELVANYSVLQRARSYAELTRWMGQAADEKYPGLVVVGTVTRDFASYALDQKEDRDKAAPRLRARGRDADNLAAARAETGMRLIEREQRLLAEPDEDMLSNLYDKLKNIHSLAYNWDAPDIDRGSRPVGEPRIRQFVRRWINEWDLRRLYPELEPDIEVTELQFRREEDTTLERPASERPRLPHDPGGRRAGQPELGIQHCQYRSATWAKTDLPALPLIFGSSTSWTAKASAAPCS